MSASLLERLRGNTGEHPIRELRFSPQLLSDSLQGWEGREDVEPHGSPIRGWHRGWEFFKRIDPTDKNDYTSISAHHLRVDDVHKTVGIWFAGQPDEGWIIRNAETFRVGRDGSITFVGIDGKYKISGGGSVHSFKPADGSDRKVVNINQLQPNS